MMNMSGKKCILFSRVSTERQTLDQQTNELINEAHRIGKEYNVIEDKESAISLDEYERHGLNELKRLIETDDYDTVICYEISRISRRPKVLYSIRDFLIERHIQLVILKPYMRLLDNDGKMSQTASIMFSLFSSLSESEMMIKKERMMRGKKMKKEQGYFIGGTIPYGYGIKNKKGHIIEDEANNIKMVYELYAKGSNRVQITKKMYELGVFGDFTKREVGVKVSCILKSENYIGNDCYPAIINDKNVWGTCKMKMENERKQNYDKFHRTRMREVEPLCKGIFYVGDTDRIMRFNTNKNKYVYNPSDREKDRKNNINIQCQGSVSINILDSLVWSLVKGYSTIENEVKKEDVERRINETRMKMANIDVQKKKLFAQIDKIEERVIKGRLSDEKAEQMENEIVGQIEEMNDTKIELSRYLDEQIIYLNTFDILEWQKEELTYTQKRQVVLKYVDRIEMRSENWNHCSIFIQLKDSKWYKYTFVHNKKGDYCIKDANGSIIKFELLNYFKSNTLNYNPNVKFSSIHKGMKENKRNQYGISNN